MAVTINPPSGTNIIRESTFILTVSADFSWQQGAYNECDVYFVSPGGGASARQSFEITEIPQSFTVDLSTFEFSGGYTQEDSETLAVEATVATGDYSFESSKVYYNLVSFTACIAPSVVEISSEIASPNGVAILSWSGAEPGTSNPITRYEVWRSESADGEYAYNKTVVTTETSGQTEVDAPSTNGSTYYYKVKTIGAESGYDSELSEAYASLTTTYSAPGVPQNVAINGESPAYAKGGEATLTWDASSDGENNPVTGYTIYIDGSQYKTTTETSLVVPVNPAVGEYHEYKVYANAQYSSSGFSDSVRVYTYSDPVAPHLVQVNGSNAAYVGEGALVALSWQGADSGRYNPIVKYVVNRDGVAYAETTETSMSVPANDETGGEYAYSIVVVGERSNAEESDVVMVYTYSPVYAPTTVSVSNLSPQAGTSISLYFSGASAGEYNPIAGYRIYEDVGGTGSYLLIANVDTAETSGTYSFSAYDGMGVTCRYKVSTLGTYGESKMSDATAEYTTKSFGACTPPTSVTIDKNSSAAGGEANLYWSGAEDGENSSIVGYAVYRSTKSNKDYEKFLETDQMTAQINASETEGQIYYYKVQSLAEDPTYNSELSGAYAWIKTDVTTGFGGNSVPASAAFHAAIKNGAKQRALIYFYDDGLWLTNDDIVSHGLSYENYFCAEEELSIGLASCATLNFSIFNEHHRLDNMRYGKFRASIGAVTSNGSFEPVNGSNVTVIHDGDTISGHDDYPYIRANGIGLSEQPGFPIKSVFIVDGYYYCIGDNERFAVYTKTGTEERNDVWQYTWSQVAEMTWGDLREIVWGNETRYVRDHYTNIAAIMLAVSERYAERGVGIVVESEDTITDYNRDGRIETYTYVDIGIFYSDKPARTKTNIITIDGYDAMTKFDVSTEDMSITFPITLYGLLNLLCAFVGVEHKIEKFYNQDITLNEDKDIFQDATAREILEYIAEAAGANAKIDYDNKLTFAWWSDTALTLNESDYTTFVPFEYTVKPIDKLQIRNSEDDIGVLTGDGTNGYIIQENPFLAFGSDAEGQVAAAPIYNQLSTFQEYTPGSVTWIGDWSYRPGDVITMMQSGIPYRYPIFGYQLNWAGNAKIQLVSTGSEYRDVLDKVRREQYSVGRKMLQISKTIDGVSVIASEAKTTSEGAISKVGELQITVDGFNTRFEVVETGQDVLESEIKQTAEEISAKVSKGEVIAEINLTPEEAKIQAGKISLEGIVTANEKFKVLLDGSIEATDGKFSGEITSGNWTFNDEGSKYENGSRRVDMSVLTGSFVGGGSGTRAFFGSSGMDVQYGADYDRNAYVRAGNVIIIAQNPEEMSEFGTAKFLRSDSGQMSIVCGESEGSSTTDTNAKGNLGLSDQYWDYTFTRVLRAGTYPGSSSRAIKQDIVEIGDMGDVLDSLVPVEFAYKKDPTQKRYGLIYEDTKSVMPVICFDDGKGDPGIVYTDLIAPMLKEIQTLRARVKALEERM